MAGLNPVLFTERVLQDFLRYQVTTHRFDDDDLQAQLEGLLNLQDPRQSPLIKGPYVSLARAFRPGPSLQSLVDEGVLHPHIPHLFTMPSVYGHQERACRSIHAGRSAIVSTGTGSGKTESFLIPIISKCLELRDQGAPPGIRAVILYPMNALAEDQLARLRELLCGTGIPFALYVGKTPERTSQTTGIRMSEGSSGEEYRARAAQMQANNESIALHPPEERVSREQMRTPGEQPRILLTNAKMLELLLTRATDVELFEGADLDFIVADEAHTFKGATGAEVACLLRRLRSFAGSERTISVATSATLSSEAEHADQVARRFASRFFGIAENTVDVVREEYVESEWASVRRPSQSLSPEKAGFLLESLLNTLDQPDDQLGGGINAAYRTIVGNRSIDPSNWENSLHAELSGNDTVYKLAHVLTRPMAFDELLTVMKSELGREFSEAEALIWMALGAAAKQEGRPLLRPVLHGFLRGIDGAVVTFPNEDNKAKLWLSAQDAAEDSDLARLGILSCTTCGTHYYQHSVAGLTNEDGGVGGGELHGEVTCWPPLSAELDGSRIILCDLDRETPERPGRLAKVFFCRHCGALHDSPVDRCLACGVESSSVPLGIASSDFKLRKCLSCDSNGREFGGSYREPAKPVRASAVAEVHVLAQNMLHHGVRKRLLIFSDNRQDAAFQAGWMRDHARRYRFRGLIQELLVEAPMAPGDLISRMLERFDADEELSRAMLPDVWEHAPRHSEPENHIRWRRFAVHALLARELTVGPKASIGLEPWGRLKVEYRGLGPSCQFIRDWSARLRVPAEELADGIYCLLDSQRRANNLLLDRTTLIWSKYHRDGDTAVQQGYIPESKFGPKFAKLRKQGDDSGNIVQWHSNRGVTGVMDAIGKWSVPAEDEQEFIEGLWRLLVDLAILIEVPNGQGRQFDLDALRLTRSRDTYRCTTCRRAYTRRPLGGLCLGYRCNGHVRHEPENENNYDLITIDQKFEMIRPREHSAQVPEKDRETLEIQFKNESDPRLNTLVATPTLELGVDIGALDTVLLRNVPPLPSNYWQRAGRAGRRHRMAVTLTYARPVSHDRSYFRDPLKMLGGVVTPPRFHLGNPVMVAKHVRSIALAHLYRASRGIDENAIRIGQVLKVCLPSSVKNWVFDQEDKVRLNALDVRDLAPLVEEQFESIVDSAVAAFSQGWPADDLDVVERAEIEATVRRFADDLQEVVNRIFKRVRWALDQRARLAARTATYGTLTPEEKILDRRCEKFISRIKGEQNRQRSEAEGIDDTITFSVLAAEGLLPGYGLDNGIVQALAMRDRTTTDFVLGRPTAMAVREFVPGNLIYANNQRLVLTTLHRTGTQEGEDLRSYVVHVENEAITEVSGASGLGASMLTAIPVSDVDLAARSRITDEEEFRFAMPVAVFAREERRHRGGHAMQWGNLELDFRKGLELTLVNVGEAKRTRGGEFGYSICRVCGQCKSPYASPADLAEFMSHHRVRCGKDVTPSGFYTRSYVDALRFKGLPSREEGFSLLEAIRQGACMVLEMEPEDLQIVSLGAADSPNRDFLLYDAMIGGSGLLQELMGQWPDVVAAARSIVEDCPGSCEVACVDCLLTYRNQFMHRYLDRHAALRALEALGRELVQLHDIPPVVSIETPAAEGDPSNSAERRLLQMIRRAGFPEPDIQVELRLPIPLHSTTPDFGYVTPDGTFAGVAIYLDGMSGRLHGNPDTQARDLQIRAYLRDHMEYEVIVIPFGHLVDPGAMVLHFAKLARALSGRELSQRVRQTVDVWFSADEEPPGE